MFNNNQDIQVHLMFFVDETDFNVNVLASQKLTSSWNTNYWKIWQAEVELKNSY